MKVDEQEFKRYKARIAGLDKEYQPYEAHHRELAEYVLPRLGRWLASKTNDGSRKNGKIVDNTGKMALRTLASGMMAGLTSPARPWFNLETPNPELAERQAVKVWLETVKKRMNMVFARSNLYDSLPQLYSELGLFGQGPIGVFFDEKNVIHTQTFTCGEYRIGNDERGVVNTFSREYRRTVSQVVERFGYKNCSETVRNQYDKGNYDEWVDLCHLVEPNTGRDVTKMDSGNKPFRSVYWEKASGNQVLEFKGYDSFPIFCPRWDLLGGDIYANACPGMDALGDIKQLQTHEKRGTEAVEKMVRPSMVADPTMRNKKKSQLPGGVTYSSFTNGKPGFQEAYQVNARINELEAKSEQIRNRINQAFYADLFLMLSMSDRRQITAREVEERHEEKLLMLGPVLERLNADLLDPLIARTFQIMWDNGLIPPPPQEIQGGALKVEYVSILHQAQRSVGVANLERHFNFASGVIQVNPGSRHKVNFDEMIGSHASMLGTSPSVTRGDDEVAELAAQEAAAIQQAQQLEQAQAASGIASDLANIPAGDDSALSQLTGAL